MFLASFALPATPHATVWEFMIGVLPFIGWAAFMLIIGGGPGVLLWVLAIPLTNLLMLLTPTFIFSLRENAWMLAPLLIVSGIIPWLAPAELCGRVLVGYYVWDASFFLMAIGAFLLAAAETRARWALLTSPRQEIQSQ
jgi:hypothetical protein